MPVTLTDRNIIDLTKSTLDNLGKMKFNQIATTLQNHEVWNKIMKQDKVKFESGTGIDRTIMLRHSGAARHTGMFATYTVNVDDVLGKVNVPWRHTTTNYAWERRELLMNKGPEKIVDLMKVRRTDAMISKAELLEQAFWTKPATSADEETPFGVPYWVVGSNTTGFNGTNPSGFSAGAGGLDSTANPRWANYTDQYTTVNKTDLIKKMRKAYRKINFKSPVDIPSFRNGTGQQYRIYVNESTMSDFEDVGEANNENLGRDIASFDDTIVFRKNPITWIPYLDGNPVETDPVYMLNFAWFFPVFLEGDFLRESDPEKAPGQPNVFCVYVDSTWNLLCTDRRQQAVLRK